MLRANQAVRLGLRAASRNPELSFGKALLDALGSALSMLPWLLAAVLVAAVAWRLEPLLGVAAAAVALAKMRWAVLGGALAARGFPRVAAAGALAYALLLVFGLSLGVAALSGAVTILARPTPATFALLALTGCFGIVGGILLEALARLMLVRAAAFGDRPLAAFARACDVLGRRPGAFAAVQLAFLLLQLVVASAAGLFTGILWAGLDPALLLLALPPRLAAGLAFGAVFAWLEVARQGALAALVA